jgi:hypothetical protein
MKIGEIEVKALRITSYFWRVFRKWKRAALQQRCMIALDIPCLPKQQRRQGFIPLQPFGFK